MTSAATDATFDGANWLPVGPAILFVPADHPDRFAKAMDRADMVILDLEDGCRPENLEAARENVRTCGLDPARTIVRVGAADSPQFAADAALVAATEFRQVLLPKAEGAGGIAKLRAAVPDAQIVALVETPLGVVRAAETAAAEGCVAMFWGAEDLTAGMGGFSSRFEDGTYRDVPRVARAQVQLAAAAFGRAMLDAVFMDIPNLDGLRAEAVDAASLGFAGSVCIHPSQVPVIREAFRPTDEQIDWAQGLMDEAQHNAGAFAYRGRMVDEPLFRQARGILVRAGHAAGNSADTTVTIP
ncbi:CoA ester lyase [uncultured Corynebacterium sp.]|uniref:HpcH/HpaI aldolase/citrate lyase family protein n=1 Tax=uncultured Corynebacterium sp. TaxID=159447 RepID=UPI0025E69352|nr:CoA ester lyase [uncultured Corynebacterium sp.]